jgi:uncharacterized phage infection (PIP) family protein YhgE
MKRRRRNVAKIKGKRKASIGIEEKRGESPVRTAQDRLTTGEEAAGASIEQIRDILFGAQMRDFEKRFARLEERMTMEVTSFREETGKRFDSLEDYLGKELESLTDRLKAEQDDRTESVKELSAGLQDTNQSFEKKISQLNERLDENSRELRQQILDQYKRLSDDIRQKHEETSHMLDQLSQELRAEKVDLSTLSELFAEIAVRLKDDLATKLNLELGSSDNE